MVRDRKPERQLLMLGDSHALFCYAGIAEAKIYWRGPKTMHRIATDGILSALPRKFRCRRNDVLVLSFGEIDCRVHIPQQTAKNGTDSLEEVDALCDKYAEALDRFSRVTQAQLALSCIVPSNDQYLEFGVYPTKKDAISDARRIRDRMNARLSMMGYSFVDFHTAFAAPDGSMKKDCSDGNVHIDSRVTSPVAEALKRAVGLEVTQILPPWPNPRQRAVPNYVSPWVKTRRWIKTIFINIISPPNKNKGNAHSLLDSDLSATRPIKEDR